MDTPTESYRYVILGGGIAAGYAAQTMVDEGIGRNELCIISADINPPYERPPLSKDFLAGDESLEEIWINDPDYYPENGIELKLNQPVTNVDVTHKTIHTMRGDIVYENLLIATGSRIRTLDVPHENAQNIFYLRRIEDSQRIRNATKDADKAVVIGGGFIGMETAAVLTEVGVDTTLVFPEERVWSSFFTPQMSDFFEEQYRDRGTTILSGRTATGFTADDQNRVTGVELDNGDTLEADMVVIGIGVEPNTDIFEGQPLEIKDGILVNRYLEAGQPNVYAAGDVARYEDVIFDTDRRVEHWDNAKQQAQHAAQGMLGIREIYRHVPYFFSDVFDLSYEIWGDPQMADEIIHRGDFEEGSFSVWWLKDNDVKAAFIMDRPDEERRMAQAWAADDTDISADVLRDEEQSLQPALA